MGKKANAIIRDREKEKGALATDKMTKARGGKGGPAKKGKRGARKWMRD